MLFEKFLEDYPLIDCISNIGHKVGPVEVMLENAIDNYHFGTFAKLVCGEKYGERFDILLQTDVLKERAPTIEGLIISRIQSTEGLRKVRLKRLCRRCIKNDLFPDNPLCHYRK